MERASKQGKKYIKRRIKQLRERSFQYINRMHAKMNEEKFKWREKWSEKNPKPELNESDYEYDGFTIDDKFVSAVYDEIKYSEDEEKNLFDEYEEGKDGEEIIDDLMRKAGIEDEDEKDFLMKVADGTLDEMYDTLNSDEQEIVVEIKKIMNW